MTRKVLVLVVVLLWATAGLIQMPYLPAVGTEVVPRVAQAASTDTTGLGPSVDISYDVQDKLWDEVSIRDVEGNVDDWYIFNSRQYAYVAEGQSCIFTFTFSDVTDYQFYIDLIFYSPYESVNLLDYDWKIVTTYAVVGPTIVNSIFGYTKSQEYSLDTNNALNTWDDGSTAITSSYCIDEQVHLAIRAIGQGFTDVTKVEIYLDEFVIEYAAVTETRRSTYDVVGGTVRYTCDWTTWDYNVDTTLTVPVGWTFKDVNPDCTESSGVFSCLVPEDYEAVYTLGALATANWQVFYEDGFEAGYTHNWTTDLNTKSINYVTVLDDQCSFYGKASVSMQNIKCVVPTGNYQVMLSVFLVAGTAIRFYHYSTFWSYTSFTSTGQWETKLLNMTIGGPDSGRNIQVSFEGASCEAYLDNFIMLNESVSTGATTTGTYNHIYPHGVVPASYFTLEYYITSWHASWTDLTVGSDGTWSLDVDALSPSAGTVGFCTRNPDDTTNDLTFNYITYPWTVSVDTTLWMVFRRGTGQIIPWNTFICYVDDETHPEPYAEITGSTTTGTSYTVNITVVDDFGQLIYQNTSYPVEDSGNSFLRETLQVYVMNLVNRHTKPCYAVVERDGETFTSPAIGYLNSFAYLVYGSVEGITYTVSWYRDHDDHLEETDTWTVYQADINVWNGYQKPEVDVPPLGLDWLLRLVQGGFFWTTFIQLTSIFAGLVLFGLFLKNRFPSQREPVPLTTPPRRSSTSLDLQTTPSDVERIKTKHDKAVENARKRRQGR